VKATASEVGSIIWTGLSILIALSVVGTLAAVVFVVLTR
jgi:hypothetical protein